MFASNLSKAKNGLLSPLPHDYTRPNTEGNVLRQGEYTVSEVHLKSK